MRLILPTFLIAALLAGCATSTPVIITTDVPPGATPIPSPQQQPQASRSGSSAQAAFSRAVSRVEPVAERYCRQSNPQYPPQGCNFDFRISTDPRLGENAFQTIERNGQPRVTFTMALLKKMQNDDEIAFILGHEAGHQIAQHIYQTAANQQIGALLVAGLLASSGQATDASLQQAANVGAYLGNRAFSKEYELEADVLAVRISAQAGYNPVKGAQPFMREETGSGALLASHPPSAQRYQTIRREAAKLGY
jgi:Zn-dependent protease with chaperone function